MTVYNHGHGWYMRFQVAGQRIHEPTHTKTKAGALKKEAERRLGLTEGDSPRTQKAPRLAEFAAQFLSYVDACEESGRLDKDTRRTYRNGWRLLQSTAIAGTRLDRIRTSDADMLSFPGSASNANQALRTLRRILSYAHELDIVGKVPLIRLREEQQREHIIEPWQEELLLEFAGPTLRDVMKIMLGCGLRPEEVCRLRWENIRWSANDPKQSKILVPDGKSAKAHRWVPMNYSVRQLLRDREGNGSDWVFPAIILRTGTRKGQPASASGHVSPTSVGGKMWREAKAAATEAAKERGFPALPEALVLYCARHTFATVSLRNGMDLATLKRVMGHSSITTTEKYLHANDTHAAEVVNVERKLKLEKMA